MATIQALIPYLQKGYTIQSVRGESFRPMFGGFVQIKQSRWGGTDTAKCSIAEVQQHTDMWDWGVLFCDSQGKNLYILTEITEIESAIARNIPYAVYDALPE